MTVEDINKQWGLQVERIQDIWEDRDNWSDQEEWKKHELLELWKLLNLSSELLDTYTAKTLEEGAKESLTDFDALPMLEAGVLFPIAIAGIDPSSTNQEELMQTRNKIARLRGIDLPFYKEEVDELLANE